MVRIRSQHARHAAEDRLNIKVVEVCERYFCLLLYNVVLPEWPLQLDGLDDKARLAEYHKRFSVWPGIKYFAGITKPFIGWIIGNGVKIDFWRDSWASDIPSREHIDLPQQLWKHCKARVSDFINSDGWNIPPDISLALFVMRIDISSIPCSPNVEDTQIWKPDIHGDFSIKNAFENTINHLATAWWWRFTWHKCLHPSLSGFAWRLMNHILPYDEIVQSKGIPLASACSHCISAAETEDHMFFDCPTAKITIVFSICRWLWNYGNKIRFDKTKMSIREIQNNVLQEISNSASLSKNNMHNTTFDLQVIESLNVNCKFGKAPSIKNSIQACITSKIPWKYRRGMIRTVPMPDPAGPAEPSVKRYQTLSDAERSKAESSKVKPSEANSSKVEPSEANSSSVGLASSTSGISHTTQDL
ncbi:hypothetical protein GIB67_015825 [Kingdonia uniflora]|uniref:Reverse transcriptase zinc-binding domain-containing protein n=1 Tax=Kingdonia uniflora TaxID=39325 RepID=A0A7J7NUU2_9MAGN|nr:hypothetical protein GIB67_015825 [Kingdonia uniflora]